MRSLRSTAILAVTFCLLAAPFASGQARRRGQQGAANRLAVENQPLAVMHNGKPAIEFPAEDGWGLYVMHGMRQGEPSLGFAVLLGQCQGQLYVTRTRISAVFTGAGCEDFDFPHQGATAERQPGRITLHHAGTSNYDLIPLGERGEERHAARVLNPGSELLVRAINNFDVAFRNVRRLAAEARAKETVQPIAPASAPKQPQANGVLSITSDPGDVQVYVNDEARGMTSAEGKEVVNLPPGAYRLRLSLPGYKDVEQQVVLASGKTQEISAKLEAAGPPPFNPADITEMLQGKMSPKRIATLVQERGVDFEVNPDLEKRFRALGATSDLLLVIATNKKK